MKHGAWSFNRCTIFFKELLFTIRSMHPIHLDVERNQNIFAALILPKSHQDQMQVISDRVQASARKQERKVHCSHFGAHIGRTADSNECVSGQHHRVAEKQNRTRRDARVGQVANLEDQGGDQHDRAADGKPNNGQRRLLEGCTCSSGLRRL